MKLKSAFFVCPQTITLLSYFTYKNVFIIIITIFIMQLHFYDIMIFKLNCSSSLISATQNCAANFQTPFIFVTCNLQAYLTLCVFYAICYRLNLQPSFELTTFLCCSIVLSLFSFCLALRIKLQTRASGMFVILNSCMFIFTF